MPVIIISIKFYFFQSAHFQSVVLCKQQRLFIYAQINCILPAWLLKDARYFQIIFSKAFFDLRHFRSPLEKWKPGYMPPTFATSLMVQFACSGLG